MDAISESRLTLVHPRLAELVRSLSDIVSHDGITFRVTQGLRTYAEQGVIYQQGRTTGGPIVTRARAGHSWHNFGLAVDTVPFLNGAPDWNESHASWPKLVAAGESLGMRSGKSWGDEPHVEMTGRWPASVPDEVRSLYAQGGLPAVWAQIVA